MNLSLFKSLLFSSENDECLLALSIIDTFHIYKWADKHPCYKPQFQQADFYQGKLLEVGKYVEGLRMCTLLHEKYW